MRKFLSLLPQPVKLCRLPGTFRLPGPFILPELPAPWAAATWDLGLLERAWRAGPAVPVRRRGRDASPLDLRIERAKNPPAPFTPASESYSLRIAPEGIRIRAPALPGLRMGIRTLAQIVEQNRGAVPCLEIEDRPALAFRAVHVDMKNIRYSLGYLERIADRLAGMKVNVAVLEYEDKFPFSPRVGVAGEDAWTRRDVRRLVSLLIERGIEPVPLQQCFGHLDYVLKHWRYANLRENGTLGQPCPLNPGSARLVRALLDEVADLHPGVRWFHMGGDEVLMGRCPRCREKAARAGTSAIYMDFVEPLVDHLIGRGYRPLLWADLFLRYYEDNRRLAGKVTLVDWNYGATEDAWAAYFWRLYREMTPGEFHLRFPDTEHPKHQKEFQRYFPRPGRPLDALYTTRYLQSRGYEVVGAPAVSTGGACWLPGLAHNLGNVICHNRSAARKGALGTLTTAWAGTLLHWETVWPGMAAGAAFGWNPATDPDDFERAFCRTFWGLDGVGVLAAFKNAAEAAPILSSYHWNKTSYDGDLGARNVAAELEERLSKEGPAVLMRLSRRALRRAEQLRRAVVGGKEHAVRNRYTLEYLELAARVLALRARQGILLLTGLKGKGRRRKDWARLRQESRRLRNEVRKRMAGNMGPPSLRRFLTVNFDGEERLPELAGGLPKR